MRGLSISLVFLLAACQARAPVDVSRPDTRWLLVERSYAEVEEWIRHSGDADLVGDATTLVFEPVEAEGDQRLQLLLQASRCAHRLRCVGDVPARQVLGAPVEITLSIICDPWNLHRIDFIPTRPGVRILDVGGGVEGRPDGPSLYVRGSEDVRVRFTADSLGLGGIKAVLSEVPR